MLGGGGGIERLGSSTERANVTIFQSRNYVSNTAKRMQKRNLKSICYSKE